MERAKLGIAVLVASLASATGTTGPAVGAGPQCAGKPATITRGGGDDVIRGTDRSDVIVAGPGNDRIRAMGHNDRVCAGPGDDHVDGGRGGDFITLGSGRDSADGDLGTDRIAAGGGADRVEGDRGNDVIGGGGGDDEINGELGDESLVGGPGNDRLVGGLGIDRLSGGPGNRDLLRGDRGKDRVDGGPGRRDVVSYAHAARRGRSRFVMLAVEAFFAPGGEGQPTLTSVPGEGVSVDLIDGWGWEDGRKREPIARVEDVVGSPFGDAIVGAPGLNVIDGGGGDDHLFAARPQYRWDWVQGAYFTVAERPDRRELALGGAGSDTCVGFARTQSCGSERSAAGTPAVARVDDGFDGATLVVLGGDAANDITIDRRKGGVTIADRRGIGGLDGCRPRSRHLLRCAAGHPIDTIVVATGYGDDAVEVSRSVPPSIAVKLDGGPGNDALTGGRGPDVLESGLGFGYDVLRGRGGNDALSTDYGFDRVRGGSGSDLLIDAAPCSGHRFRGGSGIDSVSFARTPGEGVKARIGTGIWSIAWDVGRETRFSRCEMPDAIAADVENLEGSENGDVLFGDGGANKLFGRGGNDELHGGGGADRLVGGQGRDSLLGGGGLDLLFSRDHKRDTGIACGPGGGVTIRDESDPRGRGCR